MHFAGLSLTFGRNLHQELSAAAKAHSYSNFLVELESVWSLLAISQQNNIFIMIHISLQRAHSLIEWKNVYFGGTTKPLEPNNINRVWALNIVYFSVCTSKTTWRNLLVKYWPWLKGKVTNIDMLTNLRYEGDIIPNLQSTFRLGSLLT